MDKAPPTAFILGQVFGEVKFMHVTYNLFLPRSPRSFLTSFALHYDAFDPSYWGDMCLSLHMAKLSQPILPHLCGERCNLLLIRELLIFYPIHHSITTHLPQYTHFCYFHPLFENLIYGPTFYPYITMST